MWQRSHFVFIFRDSKLLAFTKGCNINVFAHTFDLCEVIVTTAREKPATQQE